MRDRLKAWIVPPTTATDPVETLRWTRRMEVVTGLLALVAGIATWSEGWWHWLLIGTGLLGLSPWPGPASILRKARTNPGVLVHDPERRRARGRRAIAIGTLAEAVVLSAVGYVTLGWGGAAALAAASLVAGALAAWLLLRRPRA
jgi:hypothetical protein